MALPNTLNKDVPAGSDSPATLDNVIRAFKEWVEDVFGLADDVAVATALGSITADGLNYWAFFDTTANPASAGRLQRNGANLLFHDGTAARTLASTAATQTLTGKTIDLASNTLTGTVAEFNTALSDGNFATLAGTETLTNKTLTAPAINSPVLSADSVDAITEIAAALKSGADVTLVTGTAGTSGDLGVWNVDGDLVDGPTPPSGVIVGTTDVQTLTNKTITAPVLGGTATGTYTLAGTPTLTAPTLNSVAALDMGANVPIVPAAVSGTPAQHALFQENVIKGWASISWSGGTPTLDASFNVASITDTGTGKVTITWDRDFATADYAIAAIATDGGTGSNIVTVQTRQTGSCELWIRNNSGTLLDPSFISVIAIGGQ